mmetsp:Transcript_49025/g.153934  ORF Transcript_49025/g.153934 Transcript_49025/m.153934 type:complete len:262 (-) Transcript_49025:162-947(-)
MKAKSICLSCMAQLLLCCLVLLLHAQQATSAILESKMPLAQRPVMRLRGGGLISASVTRWSHDDPTISEPVHLAYCVNTTSVTWIGKTSVKEILSLVMRTCVAKTAAGDFTRVEHDIHGKVCYCYVYSQHSGLASTLITDSEYPQRVAINLVESILEEFQSQYTEDSISQSSRDGCMEFPELEDMLSKYQDPAATDKIERLKREIDETKHILQKSIDALLERGQKLEDLVLQSNKLSLQTKMMYKSVRQSAGWFEDCCGIL